jgi:regulator of cell morphogenesis and NO signaling
MKTVFELQLPALLCFVKESCHDNLHCSLNELRELASDRDLAPITHVATFVKDFIRRLQFHLAMEENDLFPLIEHQSQRTTVFPISDLLDDHDEFDKDLFVLRSMTNNFEIKDNFDDKKMYFYRKLIELERIIKNHIQLENHVLYPMVLKIS